MASKLKKIDAINPPLEVIREIGSGGMGDVFLCHDPFLDRPVVLKRMKAEIMQSRDMAMRFAREVRILSQLKHPNIVHIYAYWEGEGYRFISMEYINGWSLKQLLGAHADGKKRKPLPEWATLAVLWDLLQALEYAHATYAHKDLGPVVHRDIKPANIMVGFSGRVTLLDFGISRPSVPHHHGHSQENTQATSTVIGTVAYMSPEQIDVQTRVSEDYLGKLQGQYETTVLTPASDIFSLGILAWEMLTGQNPFLGANAIATCTNILQKNLDAKDLKGIDPQLTNLVLRMLEKKPERRPGAEELKAKLTPLYQKYPRDLSPYLGHLLHHVRKPQEVLPPNPPFVKFKPRGLSKWIALASTVGFILGISLGKLA